MNGLRRMMYSMGAGSSTPPPLDFSVFGDLIASYNPEFYVPDYGFVNTGGTDCDAELVPVNDTSLLVSEGLPSGKPSLDLNATCFIINEANALNDHAEFFFAIKDRSLTSLKANYYIDTLDGTPGGRLYMGHNGEGNMGYAGVPFMGKGGYITASTDVIDGTWKIYHVRYAGAASFLKINGVAVLTGNPGTANKPTTLTLFSSFGGTERPDAEVGMVNLYRNSLSDANAGLVIEAMKAYTGIEF